jgi:hypothetical protein
MAKRDVGETIPRSCLVVKRRPDAGTIGRLGLAGAKGATGPGGVQATKTGAPPHLPGGRRRRAGAIPGGATSRRWRAQWFLMVAFVPSILVMSIEKFSL